ncbi:MAG TPA: BTAD domain-containing putative transcriptional regulator [Actinomycetota bacterium]|nr:BTAD domain-containing putative transcriptional regulator [Actinomycetota bacterium]
MDLKTDRGPDPSSTPVRLGLLGGFRLSIEEEDVPLPMNAQRLVCFLALRDQPQQRTFVSGTLWGESTELRAGGSLRSALWRLRHPSYTLVSLTADHIALSPTVAVDLREGEALAHKVLDPSQDLEDVAEVNEEVLSADLLPDWTEDWVLLERERYHQLRLRALEALCQRLTAKGRFGQAVQAGLAAVAGEPLRESARRALIEAHLAEGNVVSALREYDSFRQHLGDELGIEPSDQIRALVEGLS